MKTKLRNCSNKHFLKFFKKIFLVKIFALFLFSCINQDYKKHGKITFHATSKNKYFIYTIDDRFYKKHSDSPANKENPRLSDAENDMLTALLKSHNYCRENSYNPKFEILSKQEKIFDATYSKLIAESYNARPLTPISYYGKCL